MLFNVISLNVSIFKRIINVLQRMIDYGHTTNGIAMWKGTHIILQLTCGVTNEVAIYIRILVLYEARI